MMCKAIKFTNGSGEAEEITSASEAALWQTRQSGKRKIASTTMMPKRSKRPKRPKRRNRQRGRSGSNRS